MDGSPEYRFDEGAIADYDQIKASAVEALRRSDGFVIVCGKWEGEEDMKLVVSSATTKMDPVVFLSMSMVEVAKLAKESVLLATSDDIEEIEE